MNLYTKEKINRMVFGWKFPQAFQDPVWIFVVLLGTAVAAIEKTIKEKETSSRSMAIGTIVMGTGFLMTSGAALETRYR
ncbi:MAG: hypothetical protein U5K00_10250 [Melioribacteraceae bacterium]|nr:hypothetical protein [Melioribacteraceae bacterium]